MSARAVRGLVGVVHVGAMPGDPKYGGGGFSAVEKDALRDGEALASGGVDAIVIENFGSAPFVKGDASERVPPHHVAFLAVLVRAMSGLGVPIGVNCLRNDVISALGIAAATGASFVRVNVHTGAYLTDQGVIEGEAHRSLRYRAALEAQSVAILADVLVKHAVPLAPTNATDATHDTILRGHADGVIVTGRATGAPVDRALLAEVRAAAGDATVLIGSGMTPERAVDLAPLADGAIVGTWLKENGDVRRAVDVARVRELVSALRGRFRPSPEGENRGAGAAAAKRA